MKDNDIDAKDLIKLINACKRARVAELKVGEVHVKFVAGDAEQTTEKSVESNFSISAQEVKVQEETTLVQQNVEAIEDRLAHMAVENPVEFEDLLIQGVLENSGTAQKQVN